MKFLNTPDDVQWLKDTALKGVPVADFASFALHGNEDAPDYVDLYVSADPHYRDAFRRVDFRECAPVYCTVTDMKG